jgi:hypothetical protein
MRRLAVLCPLTAVVLIAAGCGGSGAATKAADCLRSHGWKVAEHSSGVIVAFNEPYRLWYHPPGGSEIAVQTGWTGYGPKSKRGFQKVLPVCFRQYAHSLDS